MDGGGSGTGMTPTSGTGGPISGEGSIGGTGGMARVFNAGDAPDRNQVMPGEICERLATIQCAGEQFCCDNPGRNVDACKNELQNACEDEFVDDVAANPDTAFDADQAAVVFTELERLASQCDPTIAAYGESLEGLRSIFAGTVESGGNCRPSNVLSMQQSTAAGLSCTNYESQACVPSLSDWTCTPHAPAGGHCFTDLNCQPGLYCPNPSGNLSGADCVQRRGEGMSCELDNECMSLFCRGGRCVPADVQTAYCLANAN
jgi:hypothetical protein